mgnify:CR=1 FL=1
MACAAIHLHLPVATGAFGQGKAQLPARVGAPHLDGSTTRRHETHHGVTGGLAA